MIKSVPIPGIEDFNKIIGKTATRDISNDTQLSWEDINL